jgi:hypothetical protein
MSKTAASISGFDSIALMAFSREGTGPRTIEPTPSGCSLSVEAIRYSSSTTRI